MVGVSTWAAACLAVASAANALGEPQKPLNGGKTSKNPLTKEFASFVNGTMHKWKVPGLAISVIDGEEIYAEVIA